MVKVKVSLSREHYGTLQRLACVQNLKCNDLVQKWIEDILEELSKEVEDNI